MTQELTTIEQEVGPVLKQSKTIVIATADDLKLATNVLSELNRWADQVEEDRTKLTAPLNATLKEINARYKTISEPLKASISEVRLKMTQFQTKADAERKRLADELTARVKPGKGNLSIEKASERLAELGDLDDRVIGDSGDVTFMDVKKFEVVDFKALSDEYKLVNESAIRIAMKAGKELPGVRYWTEKVPRNFR